MPDAKRKKPGEAREPKNKITGLPPDLAKALTQRRRNADSEQLLLDMIEVWGGTRQLALDMHQEYQNAPAGGLTRQRILEMVQKLIVNNTNHDIGKLEKPSDMTDEELNKIALEFANRVTNGPAAV